MRGLRLLLALAAIGCTEKNPLYDAGVTTTDVMTGDADPDAKMDGGGADRMDGPKSCSTDDQCLRDGTGRACNLTTHMCVPCTEDKYCVPDAGQSHCDTNANVCVQCLTDAHCGGATPICNNNVCERCKKDSECGEPHVCMDDGSCPAPASVVYADGSATCPGMGTLAAPFCHAQDAITAARMTTLRIAVLRGALAEWSLPFTSGRVTVVGQNATIHPTGSANGITIDQADVLIRDLTVTQGLGMGVVATTGSVLRMRACLIDGNMGAGIQTTGAAFEIENTVVANNGGSNFAGVSLGPPGAGPQMFRNNTVIHSGFGGVTCGARYTIAGSIVYGNGGPAFGMMCAADDLCATGCSLMDPKLDETMGRYALTGDSPAACRDVIASGAPATDRSGAARDMKADCGADEYIQ